MSQSLNVGAVVVVLGTSYRGRIVEARTGRERRYRVQLEPDGRYPARDAWYAARELGKQEARA